MSDTRLHLHLDWEGASLDGLTWRDVVELVKALHDGVRTLDPDIDPARLIPLEQREGSVTTTLRIPAQARPSVERILRGPTKAWTARDYEAAAPLHDFLRRRGATATYMLGRGKTHPVIPVAAPDRPALIAATSRFFAFVSGLGGTGDVPSVTLKIGGTRKLRATIDSPDLVKQVSALFWDNAYVTLRYMVDSTSGEMLDAQLLGVEEYRHRPLIEHTRGGGEIELARQYENTAALLADRHEV